MKSINDEDFIEKFDPKDGAIGTVGYGYVGKAVFEFFRDTTKVNVYDKAKPELGTIDDLVKGSHLIFVCVPTPMNQDGKCHTEIVESVISDLKKAADRNSVNTQDFIVIVKSTVYPGFTENMQDRHPDMRIMFSPEFLTEANSIADFKTTNRVIFGGDERDARVASMYFHAVYPQKVAEDRLLLLQCEPTAAEMVKLFTNGILMTKVLFCNEMYQLCQKMEIEYEQVRQLACLDKRIGQSHTLVPGPDGQLGAGGHCFPKDIHNLRYTAEHAGVKEKIFTAVIDRNAELREDKDWERMQGRAVIHD